MRHGEVDSHEPVGLQECKGLPHGGRAHAEASRNIVLTKAGTWFKHPSLNLRSDQLGDGFSCRLSP